MEALLRHKTSLLLVCRTLRRQLQHAASANARVHHPPSPILKEQIPDLTVAREVRKDPASEAEPGHFISWKQQDTCAARLSGGWVANHFALIYAYLCHTSRLETRQG